MNPEFYCVSLCNTKTTVTFLTAKLYSHTLYTLLLRVADGYAGCLHRVSCDEINMLLKNKGSARVKVTHRRNDVKMFGEEINETEQHWFDS